MVSMLQLQSIVSTSYRVSIQLNFWSHKILIICCIKSDQPSTKEPIILLDYQNKAFCISNIYLTGSKWRLASGADTHCMF